ncbi:MAG TPA: hypothetical protein VF998_09680 [Candidatus Limnocylindria bacterium]
MSAWRAGVSGFWRNWRASELPLGPRLRHTASNLARRVILRQDCCGHYGEPGC